MTPPRWAVVGGGFLGLSLADRLSEAGNDVTLIEGSDRLGGLAAPWQLGDVVWDRHYHVTLLSDSRVRAMLEKLALGADVRWVETKAGCFAGGTVHPMADAVDFLRFPVLGLLDKARLAATIVCASRRRDWEPLQDIPASEWLQKWSGRRTWDRLWRPLLRAKLGDAYEETAASFVWATIQRLYAARRAGLKREMFGYVRGGYSAVTESFAAHLSARGVKILLDQAVRSIERSDDGLEVTTAEGGRMPFDRVVVTANARIASQLCPDLAPHEHALLQGVRHQGIVCLSLLLPRPLSPYYLTYLADDLAPFTAVVDMTALVDPAELRGHGLVYLPRYLAPTDPFFDASDEEVHAAFLPYLSDVYPDFDPSQVLASRVSRVREVFAVHTLGYGRRLPPVTTSVPGLYLVNSAQIVNGTLNIEETLKLAATAFEEVA